MENRRGLDSLQMDGLQCSMFNELSKIKRGSTITFSNHIRPRNSECNREGKTWTSLDSSAIVTAPLRGSSPCWRINDLNIAPDTITTATWTYEGWQPAPLLSSWFSACSVARACHVTLIMLLYLRNSQIPCLMGLSETVLQRRRHGDKGLVGIRPESCCHGGHHV